MLNDTDEWPVTCAECGQVMQKQIGWLKHAVSIICVRCGASLTFRNDTFLQVLENAKSAVDGVARGVVLTEKKR
jgi:hypothetical protein